MSTAAVLRGLLALAATLALTPFVIRLLRGRVVDVPNHRSLHAWPTPRGGGIAPALGCLAAAASWQGQRGGFFVAALVTAGLLGVLGLVDDLKGLAAFVRLPAQMLVAAIAAIWLTQRMTGSDAWHALFGFGVVLWIVAYVNGFNFMDGINGISSAQTMVSGTAWLILGAWKDVPLLALLGAVAFGAGGGFLPFNFPKARVFLGDVGSYFLGAWLAVTAVIGLRARLHPEAVLAPLALYSADTASTIIRRAIRHERIWEPHRDHVYQRLCTSGWTHVRTVGYVTLVMAVVSALGLVAEVSLSPGRAVVDVAGFMILGAYLASPKIFSPDRLRTPSRVPGAEHG